MKRRVLVKAVLALSCAFFLMVSHSAEASAARSGRETIHLAGLKVAVFVPSGAHDTPLPLILFSHGFHGSSLQSTRLLQQVADAGYIVFAPNHADSSWSQRQRAEVPFARAKEWSDQTYHYRYDDMTRLLAAMKMDPEWSPRIDFSRLGLIGHSLGGYTVLGLEGAWPAWRMDGIKAVVAWSPYTNPFVINNTLTHLTAPTMYQSGTRDGAILHFVSGRNGAFAATHGPKELVVLDGATHFAWTNLNGHADSQRLIAHYTIAWLDKYVRGIQTADPLTPLRGASVRTR